MDMMPDELKIPGWKDQVILDGVRYWIERAEQIRILFILAFNNPGSVGKYSFK
jgi:hypothetical protein